jgi:anti-sigma B factor antagonist
VAVEFDSAQEDGVLRVELTGDLDMTTAGSVEERLMELEAGDTPARVVLDLRGLRFIDSTGLSLLINAANRGRKAGWPVTVVSGTGASRRILETTGLSRRLDVVEG